MRGIDYTDLGATFETYKEIIALEESLSATPLTFEVLMQLSPGFNDRGGVLVGNYTASGLNVINLEIYTNGAPRFYYRKNGTAYTIQFTTDVRSENKTHLAVTIDGLTANLYVNGVFVESVALTVAVPSVTDGFCIGGDARTSNYQNFKGTIYAVHLFSDVRSAKEIKRDAVMVQSNDNSLILSKFLEK